MHTQATSLKKITSPCLILLVLFQLSAIMGKAQFREIFNGGGQGAHNYIHGMSFITPSTGFVAFNNSIGFTQDSGKTYLQRTITAGNTNFNGYTVNLTFGFNAMGVTAFSVDSLFAFGDFGAEPSILFSANGGQTWKLVFHLDYANSISNTMHDVQFPSNGFDRNNGIAISDKYIMHSSDKGQTWQVVLFGPYYSNSIFVRLSAPNNNDFAICGNILYQSGDYGLNWSSIYLPQNLNGDLIFNNVSFFNAVQGYVTNDAEGTVYSTQNGGFTWTKMNDEALNPVYAGDMYFTSLSTGYIASKYSYDIYKTTDNGVHWERCVRNPNYQAAFYGMNKLSFYNAQIGWAAADGSQYLSITTNGGSPTRPNATFSIDTTNLSVTGTVNLVNSSTASYTFKWFKNSVLLSTAYNTSYTHNIYNPEDSIMLVVTNATGQSDTLVKVQEFSIPPNTPVITSFSPTSGGTGSSIYITGINLSGVTAVSFGGIPAASYTINSATSITAQVGAGATGNVSVTNPVTTATKAGFTFTLMPGIGSFSPTTAGTGTTVNIIGNNFTNVTAVSFGGINALSFVVNSPTSITAVVGNGMSGAVSVTNAFGTGLLNGFTYIPAPTLSSFSPASGVAGNSIMLAGTNLSTTTSVSFGGTPAASFTINSDVSITAVLGTGSVGNISVTTLGGTAFIAGFIFIGPPTIQSFTPDSGPVGTLVTITGTNFSSIPSNNIVYVGAEKTTVNTASSNTITFTVPTGLNADHLTVTTNGLTCISNKTFKTTFPGDSVFRVNAFGANVDFTGGKDPYEIITADFDGDGKLDIVSPDLSNHQVMILKNSYAGTGFSFAPAVSFPVDWIAYFVAAGDLNGDGKPDLVVGVGGSISVLKNTSSPGNISFDPYITLTSGGTPYGIAIGDFDGDGRPDIAAAVNQVVSIFKNTSSNGNISFAPKVDLSTGMNNYYIAINDLNQDGKPDIVVSGFTTTLSIFQNNSTSAGISFLPHVDYATNNSPKRVCIGDLDGDGKPDIVLANQGSVYFSVFKNISTGAAITVTPKIDFGSITGGAKDVFLADMNGDGKLDVVATEGTSTKFHLFKNNSTNGNIAFSPKVEYPFTTPNTIAHVTLGDFDLDNKPDILLGQCCFTNTFTILKNNIIPPVAVQLCNPLTNTSFTSNTTGASYQWQVDTGTGFSNVVNNSNYSGANLATLQLNNIPSSWYGYDYRCTVGSAYSDIFVIKFTNTWTGAINSDWGTAGNWSCGTVPDNNTDVIINSGTIVLNTNTSIRSLSLGTTAHLTINTGFTLTVLH